MNLGSWITVVTRGCFSGGFVVLALVLAEELALSFGNSFLYHAYTPDTLLNIGAILFLIVISLLLRQIREELKTRNLIEGMASITNTPIPDVSNSKS